MNAYQMVIVEAGEEQFIAVSSGKCRFILFDNF